VSTHKFVLATNQYVYAPGFNSYCIGVDLTASTVGLSVNGIILVNSFFIKLLNYDNALLLSSTLLVYNEMFTLVNIYSTNLAAAVAAKNGPGQILDWNAANWTKTFLPDFQAYRLFIIAVITIYFTFCQGHIESVITGLQGAT
jgi:hypothetical protein